MNSVENRAQTWCLHIGLCEVLSLQTRAQQHLKGLSFRSRASEYDPRVSHACNRPAASALLHAVHPSRRRSLVRRWGRGWRDPSVQHHEVQAPSPRDDALGCTQLRQLPWIHSKLACWPSAPDPKPARIGSENRATDLCTNSSGLDLCHRSIRHLWVAKSSLAYRLLGHFRVAGDCFDRLKQHLLCLAWSMDFVLPPHFLLQRLFRC